jgi:periplasmic protein TonB
MVRIGRFLGEDKAMSTTAFEVRGPNKALFRAAAVAGSAIICSTLGYFALTYVPKFEMPVEFDGPIVETEPVPKPKDLLPPPVLKQKDPEPVQTTLSPSQDPSSTPPTIYAPPNSKSNPLPGVSPAGPPPTAPTAAGTGASEPIGVSLPLDPPIVLVPPIPELAPIPAPPPSVPQVVINPVKMAGANPIFPGRALDDGVSGEVSLSFTVLPNGKVDGIRVLSENPPRYNFARAAIAAISTWTFQPQTIDGNPVAYPARYTISFKLED